MATGGIEDEPRERRSLLKAYYGLENTPSEKEHVEPSQELDPYPTAGGSGEEKTVDFVPTGDLQDPVDINGKYFVCKKYMDKMLSECNLNQLDEENGKLSQQVRQLDSEIQTLVYENYNKFIAATDTIRQMRQDFRDMEEEMKKLEQSMSRINGMSTEIDTTLSPHKATINKLASIHELLRKLQFLYDLPGRLKKCLEMDQHALAVRYHVRALPILKRYKDTPAFTAIHDECNQIIQALTGKLHNLMRTKSPFSDESSESMGLLLKLDEDRSDMIELFLEASRAEVETHFARAILPCKSIEEYVRVGCEDYLGILQKIGVKFREIFSTKREPSSVLDEFVQQSVGLYLKEAEKFLLEKVTASDPVVVVRSLDRLYKQVLTLAPDKLIESTVSKIALSMIELYQNQLEDHFNSLLRQTHTDLINFDRSQFELRKFPPLTTMHESLHDEFRAAFKANLIALKEFLSSNIRFSQNSYFREQFCVHGIREGLVRKTFQFVLDKVESFPNSIDVNKCPEILLILSRLCLDLGNSTISFLTSKADDMFQAELSEPLQVSPLKNSLKRASKTALNLLNSFVFHTGDRISNMFHVSLVSSDWMEVNDPMDVRDVIRRVVDELSYLDTLSGMLFDEGVKEENSDSSRKNYLQGNQVRKPFYGNQKGSSLIGSINVSRLFSERMTYYNSVHFNKLSILTGIIKISLKAFLESVRYCTFGKYGLHQIQIDLSYLHVHIWRFVSNEDLVLDLLEDILTSTISRCVQPTMMDSKTVDEICNAI